MCVFGLCVCLCMCVSGWSLKEEVKQEDAKMMWYYPPNNEVLGDCYCIASSPCLWLLIGHILLIFSVQAGNGIGAKTDNLLLVANEYRGLSWRWDGIQLTCVLKCLRAHNHGWTVRFSSVLFTLNIDLLFVYYLFFSIGGDANLANVTTLPSEYYLNIQMYSSFVL